MSALLLPTTSSDSTCHMYIRYVSLAELLRILCISCIRKAKRRYPVLGETPIGITLGRYAPFSCLPA